MEGNRYWSFCCKVCERVCVRFHDALLTDWKNGDFERKYFVGEWRDLEVMGWTEFCERMEEEGQKDWLEKIKRFDEEILANGLEKKLAECLASEKGDETKSLLEQAVKLSQAMVGRSKVVDAGGDDGEGIGEIIVKFIDSRGEPIEIGGEALESEKKDLARKGTLNVGNNK